MENLAWKPKRRQFGFSLWNVPVAQQVELAILGESLGYDLIVIGEHVVTPVSYQSFVPAYSDDPIQAAAKSRTFDETTLLYDLFTVAGAMFQATSRISILTGVHLLGLRNPLLSALGVRTLHELSRGRFMLGVAAGWNKEEFDAVGVPFATRGSRLDEGIEIMKAAMKGGPLEYLGEHFAFDPVQVSAAPFEVPIIVGGNGPPALRRAARVGDGYFASGENSIEQLLENQSKIDTLRAEYGTDARAFQHWLKITDFNPTMIDDLVERGNNRFVLYGGDLWALEPLTFEERCRRLRDVAARLDIQPRSAVVSE